MQSRGEISCREVELGSHSRLVCLAAKLLLNSWFSGPVFVTLLRTAVGAAISEVHNLLGTGGVPTTLALLFWWWLTVSSVFAVGGAIHLSAPSLLFSRP